MIVQTAEHLDDESHTTFERQAYARLLGVQHSGYLELTAQLVSRPPRIDYELPELSERASTAGFRDIG